MSWKPIMPGVYEGLPKPEIDVETSVLFKMSNIPAKTLETHRLGTWKHRGEDKWVLKVKEYISFNYSHPFLTLLGATGTGKTHIAFAIGWEWLIQGKSVLYNHGEDLLDSLRDGYSRTGRGDSESYDNIMRFTQNVGLLILDDLGAEQETKWSIPKLEQIIDYRYVHQKPLIVTTNIALNRLPSRIADRLAEGILIQLTGESFRRQKKTK